MKILSKRNLQRLFACCMVICMVFTMCSAMFTVGAATPQGTVTVEDVTITDDATEATVSVTTKADEGLKAATVWVSKPTDLTVTKVELVAEGIIDNLELTYVAEDGSAVALGNGDAVSSTTAPQVVDGEIGFTIIVADATLVSEAITIKITYAHASDYAGGNVYDITIGEETKAGFDKNDDLITLTTDDGKITVNHKQYEETVTAPTCTEAGYTTYTCVGCDHSYTDNAVDALGHTPAEAVEENREEATCTTPGSYESVVYCSVCGEEISRETVVIPVIPHTEGEAVIENQVYADCDTDGSYDEVVYCSVCGDELSREAKTIDALGHTEAEAVIENNVDATCTTAGSYDTVVYCTVCSEELSRVTTTVDALEHDYAYTDNGDGTHSATCANGCAGITNEAHNYVDGTCVCGAKEVTGPVVDTNLVFRDTSIAYGASSLELSFRVRNTVLDLYDNVSVVIIPQRYDPDTLNLVENPVEIETAEADLAAAGSSNKTYVYKDAYLYELGLTIDYMLRGYDAEGNLVAVSETFKTSGAQIIKEIYAKQSANPKMQTLLTDTLIVGQEAINSMKIGLPDSDLGQAPSIIGDFDISAATQGYDSYNTVDDFTSFYDGVSTDKTATHRVIKSVTIGKVPYPTYRLKDTNQVFDLDKFGFRVAYTQVDGAGTQTPFDQTFTTANSNAISYVNGYVNFKYESIALQDSNQDITFEITYDGVPVFTSVYSMETFLGANLTNANTGALMDALIKLGVSFRAYSAN